MSAQPEDQQMEGVQDTKGKGKATQQNTMEESDDSSDESAGEEAVCLPSLPKTLMETANKPATGRRTYEYPHAHLRQRDANLNS